MTQYIFTNKLLAFGIILLFVGIAFLPSINQSIVKASTDNNLIENQKVNSPQVPLKKINNYQIKNFVNNLIGLLLKRHPFLLKIIGKLNNVRLSVCYSLIDYCTEIYYHGSPPRIIHPMVFLLACVVFLRIEISMQFWYNIDQLLKWGWTYDEIAGS